MGIEVACLRLPRAGITSPPESQDRDGKAIAGCGGT